MRTWMIFALIFLGVFSIILLGILTFGGNLVNSTLGVIDVTIGNQSFSQTYNETLGQGINAFVDQADNWGIALLFGMVILMLITSFVFASNKKTWIIIEVGILIVMFIFTVTLQSSYNTAISSSTDLFNVYSGQLTKSSTFILNLHLIVPIVWALMVILAYSSLPKPKKEDSFADISG